jgi:NADH-quinone oxidoreductase subunit J
MEAVVFIIAAAVVLAGALGVVLRKNPVHCALSLVMTLFGVAVLFIAQDAQFLAAVQVIVYAGAIVVLFLFVIMLLGVDRAEQLTVDPIRTQRPLAAVVGVGTLGLLLVAFFVAGKSKVTGKVADNLTDEPNINQLARSIFGNNVLAFEVTSIVLLVAAVGGVVLGSHARTFETPMEHDARS